MDLSLIIILLTLLAIAFFIASFFVINQSSHAQEELEELALQQMREIHQVKTRLATVEESLSIESSQESFSKNVLGLSKKQIITLYTQGHPIEDIAVQTNVAPATVKSIVDQYIAQGL
ncbi:helix-turn-helix domain-containing protein [Lacticigenium naphthae]|uniref:helix-turn-helix domain-containing protein n=1 Tax=Lacticigenium naphthae TaxID=515351 RepID=UPI0004022E68|nr:helix-turn-helix domain-containing protein [Lacticigenium naphthae]